MIKFHRPDFLIAPVDTAPAKRNLLQKIFHKKKDDLSPAERRKVQICVDRSSRTKLLGGLITIDPHKNITRQTAGLLPPSQEQKLLTCMNDSASTLDELGRNLGTQPLISAGHLLENVEKIRSTLMHIDHAELSGLCNQPGEQGDLAKSRILESLNNLETNTRDLRAGTLKALDSQESVSLPATDKHQLMQVANLLGHIQKHVEVLQNKKITSTLTEEDETAHPVIPNRNFSHLPQMRNHPFSNLRISTGDGTFSKMTIAEYYNIPRSPRTPDSWNDTIHSSEMDAARLPRGLGWPLLMLIEENRNFDTEQIVTTSHKGKEIFIAPEETGNETGRPASPLTTQASSSRPLLHREYNVAPPPAIPARLKNEFATSSEPIVPANARPLDEQELSVIKAWTRRVTKSMLGSTRREFMSEIEALVKTMTQDGQLRDVCIDLMRDGLTDCIDRALVMWQKIGTQKYIRDAELGKYTISDVYDMGIRTYRLAQVDEHARQLIKNISDNKRLKKFGEKEEIEVILHARESLRDLLNLPISETNGIWGIDAARIPGMFSVELVEYGKAMLRAELEDGKNDSHQVAHFLASWTPITQQLRRLSPELQAIHQAIDTHRDAISSAIEEHKDGDLKWNGLAPLTSASYDERLKQCGKEAEDMHFAADLAAVKTFMYGHHETDATQKPPLEVELEKVSAVRTQTMAQRFIPALKEALASGQINPSWVHPINRWNLLHVAAASCDPELVKALKELGVDMHQADNKGMLPLHVAALTGSAASIRALGDLKNINTRDKTGNSPVHWAAYSGSVDAFGALFQKSNAQGSQEALDQSLSSGVDVNINNSISGETPLHIAVKMEKFSMARMLIGAGADPRIKDQNNKTVMDLLKHASAKNDPQGYKLTKKALEMEKKMKRLQE